MLATGNKTLNTYKLSIRAFADGFSFSVVSLLDGTLMREEEMRVEPGDDPAQVLTRILQRPRLTHYNYTAIELQVASPATIIPLDAFHREDMVSLYRLNFPQEEARKEDVQYEMLSSMEVVVLFSLNVNLRNAVTDLYPEATVRSLLSICMERALAQHRKGDMKHADFFAYVGKEQMTLCAMREGKLHFACSYDAKVDADRLFHLLAVWKTLEMDIETDICHAEGLSDHLQEELRRYIRNVETVCE